MMIRESSETIKIRQVPGISGDAMNCGAAR